MPSVKAALPAQGAQHLATVFLVQVIECKIQRGFNQRGFVFNGKPGQFQLVEFSGKPFQQGNREIESGLFLTTGARLPPVIA